MHTRKTSLKYAVRSLACAILSLPLCAALPSLAADKYWVGGTSGDWSGDNWADASGGAGGAWVAGSKAIFESAGAVTVSGASAFNVGQIENTGAGTVSITCPVAFSGTYNVLASGGRVRFPGGATATYPDNSLRTTTATANTLRLDGDFTFTADWTVPSIGNDDNHPWVVTSGSTVHGKNVVGANSNTALILKIEEGGKAYFDSMALGNGKGEVSVDGYLEVAGDITLAASCSLGRDGNIGTVKANCIKKISGSADMYCRVPNLIVGAGGIGTTYKDYSFKFACPATITATADFNVLGMYRDGGTYDWGLNLNGYCVTFDIPADVTVTFGVGISENDGVIRKKGAGKLVMTNTYNGKSDYQKRYKHGTIIDEGTVRLAANGQLGTSAVWIANGARLEVASGVSFSNVVSGEGTLYLEDGVTLTASSTIPMLVGEVVLADGASVTVAASDTPSAPASLLSGVSSADYSRFTVPSGFSFAGGALVMPGTAAATDFVWAGASGDDWATPASWLVNGATPAAAPTSADTIRFENAAPVAVGGAGTLEVAKIVTTTSAKVTFNCPVQFAATYLVENAVVAPTFAGGATATFPDSSLTGKNQASHTLSGAFTFTQGWTVPLQAKGNPFILAANSTISGAALSAAEYNATQPDLRIDAGSVATFDSIAVAGRLLFWLNGGRLVSLGDITVGGADTNSARDFGYYPYNIGTVEANGIYKNVTSYSAVNIYATNMVVGAGGFGMHRKDYSFYFYANSRLTAKDDMTIYQPIADDGPKDSDWGLRLSGRVFTIDTANHTVTFDSTVLGTPGYLVKEGAGEMIMQSRLKQHTGGTILNGGLTTVKLAGSLGYCPATVNSGATLAFADTVATHAYPITVKSGGTLANTVTVGDSSTLALEAGAVLKPVQNTYFDVSSGFLVLPVTGTVTVDMTDFTFVNGVPNPVLCGAGAGDEAKFSAIVPEGIVGSFSVSGGFLYYTATSGGSAAADLYWHPASDSTWSTAVAAWTNAVGEQVAFEPYADVTVADAATISLPADVAANNVRISADGDVALNGAGKLGGPGTILKTGEGTFTFNATGGLDAQPIIVSNGVFKIGGDLTGTGALGAAADTSPIVVADGATLDFNYTDAESPSNDERSKVTHDKLVRIAGDGFNGQGAVVNTSYSAQRVLGDVVLDADASVGGSKRIDVRGSLSGYTKNGGSITGPGKVLTVKNTEMFGIVNASVNLDSIVVTNGGVLRLEGTLNGGLDNGVRLIDGGAMDFYGGTITAAFPIVAESGANTIRNSSGTATINAPISISEGATLTHTGGNAIYAGTITGTMSQSGGYVYINGAAPANGWTVNGAKASERVYMRQSGMFTGADITTAYLCIADVADSTVDVTFNDSTIDVLNLLLGWGGASTGRLSIGPGTTATAGKIAIGDTGTSTSKSIKSVLSVDGGTVHHTGSDFYIAHSGPHSDFVLNSGEVTVDTATIRLRNGNQALGGYNTSRFIQNGGVFNYGGAGFDVRYEDNNEDGQIVLKGGEMNASANWSIPKWIPLCFKDGDADGWTLNQADGTTATWTTALRGDGDVTLNGEATLTGNKEVQGVVGGLWTIGDGFTAGLEGAASLLGGLALGNGATATVDIATNRSAVFTARDYGNIPGKSDCITNRFNKAIGGTTRGTITHDETFLFTKYAQADRPFGNLSYTAAYAVGQFYVEEGAAGEWSFTGNCDDYAFLWIDGEPLIATTGSSNTGTATKTLAAGWHSFRHLALDNSGAFGNAQTIGYKDGSGTMSTFARFNVKNLKMRPAADMGDPENANTLTWSHYKGDSTTVTASTFKNDFEWDFRAITNTLQKLQWYGSTDTTWINTYTVNRYEGWFFVTAENAGKEWVFRSRYDDRCALWIDGVDSGLDGNSGSALTYAVTLSQGWHRFRIQTADFTGSAGPWSGSGNAVSYQIDGGAQTLFSEATLLMTVCPDGYVQGGVTLASNATLSNTATGAATVYGDVTATGTNAVISGGFKFEGGTLAFQNVAPNARDLSAKLAFENEADDYLANVGAIAVDFTSKPTVGRVTVCPAGGLTTEAAAAKVSATLNGEPIRHAVGKVENGNVVLSLPVGFMFLVR